jgi:glutamine amidotransferase-like uncharacterized protein
MSSSTKVFIYSDDSTSSSSAEDLKALLASKTIFGSTPDVTLSDFNFNPSQLTRPVFVVPGAVSSTRVGLALLPKMAKMRAELQEHFDYVGVCAGSFLATQLADYYVTLHDYNVATQNFDNPMLLMDDIKNLGVVKDYKAVGAFYPNNGYAGQSSVQVVMPYRVTLSLPSLGATLSQLYVSGPAFIQAEEKAAPVTSTVVATYADKQTKYPFFTPTQFVPAPAAILSQPATSTQGARFIAGTHIESCVPDSKFLKFFEKDHPEWDCGKLPEDAMQAFKKEQSESLATVEALLGAVLKR